MLLKSFKDYISQLNVGDKLPNELTLCKEFNVSRGTIREVISHMRMLGILERTARKGTFVKAPSIKDISETLAFQLQVSGIGFEELKEMRLFLELSQLPLLIKLATPVAFDKLNTLINEMEENCEDPGKADLLDVNFHMNLVEICGNRILNIFSQVITLMFDKKYRTKFLNKEAAMKSVNDHRKMMQYIKEGNLEELRELVTEHIRPL